MALTTGRLPIYENLDPEMLQACDARGSADSGGLELFADWLAAVLTLGTTHGVRAVLRTTIVCTLLGVA